MGAYTESRQRTVPPASAVHILVVGEGKNQLEEDPTGSISPSNVTFDRRNRYWLRSRIPPIYFLRNFNIEIIYPIILADKRNTPYGLIRRPDPLGYRCRF